jgi:hypothetical protein
MTGLESLNNLMNTTRSDILEQARAQKRRKKTKGPAASGASVALGKQQSQRMYVSEGLDRPPLITMSAVKPAPKRNPALSSTYDPNDPRFRSSRGERGAGGARPAWRGIYGDISVSNPPRRLPSPQSTALVPLGTPTSPPNAPPSG